MGYLHPGTVFVLYRGDDVLGVGTSEELAKEFDIPERMVRLASAPSMIARAAKTADTNQLVAVRVTPQELAA